MKSHSSTHCKQRRKKVIGICLSNPNGWKHPNIIGGGEIITKQIFTSLSDFNILIIQFPKGIFTRKDRNVVKLVEIKVPFISSGGIVSDVLNFLTWSFLATINLALLANSVDVIYSPTTNISDFLPSLIISKIFNKRLIAKCHITIYQGTSKNNLVNIYTSLRKEKNSIITSIIRAISSYVVLKLLKLCDHISCTTNTVMQSLLNSGIPQDRLSVNLPGVEVDHFQQFRQKLNHKKYDLCFMSRIEKYKGIMDFIKICTKYRLQNPNFRAIIIGEGTYFSELKQLIVKNHLEKNVSLTGFIKDSSRFIYLGQSKLFIFPSTANEGYGLVIAESLACGTPVIAYDNPIFKEVYRGVASVLLCNSYHDMKVAVFEILSNKQKLTNLTDDATAEAYNFNLKKTIENEDAMLKRIISSKNQ